MFSEDYFVVHPENSEAQRRIGAKGTNCVLHISPYGITLALQVNSFSRCFHVHLSSGRIFISFCDQFRNIFRGLPWPSG